MFIRTEGSYATHQFCLSQDQGEVTAGTEEFRNFIFEKVQSALEIVCTDGVTETTVDNVTPLLKTLDVDTSDEGVIDLMRDALVDNFGIINPLDLDQVVQKAQEANELTEMDDCLEVAFKLIDFDEDEFITQKDIYKLGLRLGEELAEFALDEMVDAVDMDKDGKISLRDFRYFLLGRDVPSRKEIFAMAEAARKKREEEEERKREEEEKKENERQAKLYQKIKDGEIIGVEDSEHQDKTTSGGEEGGGEGGGEEGGGGGQEEVLEESGQTTHENKEEKKEEKVEEQPVEAKVAVPKTEAELLREKRKSMFAGYASAVAAANIIAKQNENSSVENTPSENVNNNDKTGDDDDDGKKEDVFGDDVKTNDDDFDEDDFDREELAPIPLQTSMNLNLPPPDLSTVIHALPSPLASPRRPTIVGIGGLGVSQSNGDRSLAEAIQRLEEDMFRTDNLVPERPRRRRSTCSSVDEPLIVNSKDDVEDYNNRLVFKLPPRRKSSCTPPVGLQRRNSGNERRPSNISIKCAAAIDSDEGIDLADEEMVEPTLVTPCGAAAPSVSLRISLPQGNDSEGAVAYDEDKMNVSIITRKGRRRSSSSLASIRIDERGKATLGIGPYSDTPRSMSRSEFSVTHMSYLSPRMTDDEDNGNYIDDDLETTTSKAAIHTASNTSGYDCDGDSIVLSLQDNGNDNALTDQDEPSNPNDKLSHYKKGRLKKGVLKAHLSSGEDRDTSSPTPSFTRRKSAARMKRSLSCQKIEIKELTLNEPVSVDQFSNRHRFGMIPKDVSKFIVLGKNPTSNEQGILSTTGTEDSSERFPRKSSTVRWKELPDMIRPILRHNRIERAKSKATPVKEHSVLQGRRLSLFHDLDSPVMKHRQDFDLPLLPDKIQIPTGNDSTTSEKIPDLETIKKMEKKILKRSQTSFDLPNVYEGHSDSVDTARSEHSKSRRNSKHFRPHSARRVSSPVAYYDSDGSGRYSARNRKVTVVDLSKSLRRDTACKNMASLSKKHSGFKSIVPLARVVMAYQSSKKRQRETGGFYSISRQLEKSGVPFNSTSSASPSPRRSANDSSSNYTLDKKRRCKSAKGRSTGSYFSSKNETDDLYLPLDDQDIHTLVGDLNDTDALPAHVVFQKVRPATAHAGMSRNISGSRSNIVTLEIPETNKFEKKLKNVSLLSKLPIK